MHMACDRFSHVLAAKRVCGPREKLAPQVPANVGNAATAMRASNAVRHIDSAPLEQNWQLP